MPTNEALLEAVRGYVAPLGDIVEKRIIKGIGFMWRGNLLCGVSGDQLLVRVDEKNYERWIAATGAEPMIMGSREAKGWIYLDQAVVGTQAGLSKWVDRAIEYSITLPAK